MLRTYATLGLLLVLGWSIGGCPQDDSGSASLPPPTASALAPAGAAVGETVVLSGAVQYEGAATYKWYQTAGRLVTLQGAESLQASFVAPSMPTASALRFRLDVRAEDGTVASSAEVVVEVAADPDYVQPGSAPDDDGGGDDSDQRPQVRLVTSLGDIVVELDRRRAPISVENFLSYVDDGTYENTLWHRVIEDFVIQGGGFDEDFEPVETRDPIVNEGNNGLRNNRGTIAMARTNDPDSATSQFYINLVDNDTLNATDSFPGYAVFGEVIEGLDVVDEIGVVETGPSNGFQDVPVENVLLIRVERI